MKEAMFYSPDADAVVCGLCPHFCRIRDGRRGICRVRKNSGGTLIAESYGQISSMGFDPVEKKPLYHFYPGQIILSVGSVGCNLQCKFCQNWEISQTSCEDFGRLREADPGEIVDLAMQHEENIGIAYTYNEPAIWFEFMMDIAKPAAKKGLKNVMVTNGFITQEALEKSFEFIDAYSVDLKAFNEEFFKKLTKSRLQPVLEALKRISEAGKHLEVTNLVIPNRNDDPKEFRAMIDWIAENLGAETVLHISRYYPTYQLDEPATPEKELTDFYKMASRQLDYVYLGNIRTGKGQNTYCPKCKSLLIERSGYLADVSGLNDKGDCSKCGQPVIKYTEN